MRVRLAAQDPSSTTGGRLRRQVSARIGGRWVDVGRYLLAEGHALWMPNGIEWAWNGEYADLSRQAAAAGLQLWDTHGCGDGPSPGAALTMHVNFDAKRNDRFNVNGEWAEIHNDSASAVPLEGWWFRDSALRRYTFQKGAVVPAGGTVTAPHGLRRRHRRRAPLGPRRPAVREPQLRRAGDRRRRLPVRPARQPARLGDLQLVCGR